MKMGLFRELDVKMLERQYSERVMHQHADKAQYPKGKILLCAEVSEATSGIFEWAAQHGSQIVAVDHARSSSAWLSRIAEQVDYLIVSASFVGDIEDTVDLCLRIRRSLPSLRIILISDEVRGHDLTCERMSACDVTLKGPVTAQCLNIGAQVARENHVKFMNRRCAQLM